MASARTSFKLLCVCTLLLALVVADVSAAAPDVNQQQPAVGTTAPTAKFYLRGNVEAVSAESEFIELLRRELQDYGSHPAGANCSSKPCKK